MNIVECGKEFDSSIRLKNVNDWKQAIKISVDLLLKKELVDENFEKLVIDNIEKNGPYIVLADYFALPHAVSYESVKKVCYSLLFLEEEVDLLGNPVKVFLTLASPNSTAHLESLSWIAQKIGTEENISKFKSGNIEDIIEIFR